MISRNPRLTAIVLAALSLALTAGVTEAQSPIRYTGDISPTFGAVNDSCAFEITLWNATADGTRIGPVIERELEVRDGRYSTELDFGPEAAGESSRYLQVAVGCPAGTAGLTTLTRRAFNPSATAAEHRHNNAGAAPPKAALRTAFTYQGELKESGAPVTGSGDFQFSLWDAASGGTQIGATVPVPGVAVADGRFTASLDFGAAAFDGDARWLEITVDYPSGTGSPTTLSPRQPLSAAPYALQTRGVFVDDTGNVGVGTDTPTDPFHVVGSTTMEGGLHIDSYQGIQFPDLTNRIYTDLGDLRFESAGDIEFNPAYDFGVDGDTLIVDSSLNRVGIGTSSPISLLDVSGNASVSNTLFVHGNVDSPQFDVGQNVHFSTINGGWIGLGDTEPRIVFDYQRGNVSIQSTDLAIGTTEPDEMLHVEDSTAGGLAFLKLQTSHPTDWGETGIRWETPQNRWHLRMDDDANNNIPQGALGLRCNTPGHEIMTWTETGMVGIGNTNPSAKLDVVGDLELSGAYRGSIGPNNGAPFPRPAYDSGWVAIAAGSTETLTHGIGGSAEDYVVDLQFKDDDQNGIHIALYGGLETNDAFLEALWKNLTSSSVEVTRMSSDLRCEEVRVRIWVVN